LRDILETIDAVAEMMVGVDLAGYRRDYKLRRALSAVLRSYRRRAEAFQTN
jgi:hypothetical protein